MKYPTALLMACLGAPVVSFAAAPVDLTGVWSITEARPTLKTAEGATPPLTAAGRKLYDEHLKAVAKGDRASFDETTICLPPGLPRLMFVNKPFEILQRDKAVYFVHQDNRMPRRAYFGEQLPVDPDPLYLGFSVARWDGNALVIDSSGFREGTLLDDGGLPHSPALKLTERYELDQDGKTLRARFTIDDAPMYTKPWTAVATYRLKPGAEIPEEVCSDSMKPPAPVKSGG
jgi:hypothetical protein